MKEISILEWNINQRGRGEGIIPSWVKDEIGSSDIVILTEFCTKCRGRDDFIMDLEQLGYHCAVSENSKGNDILIAVKSKFCILGYSWEPCYGEDTIPENLRVDIDCDGRTLTVVGIRIKSLDGIKAHDERYRRRKRELRWVLNWIKDPKGSVLISGDFNNNRRGSPNTDWSLAVMEEMLKEQSFCLYTPEGSSIYEEKPQNAEFPYDHFAAKGVKITPFSYVYDRDFTRRDPLGYFLGRDFRKPWYPGAQDLPSVSPPLPDHAILKGTLSFETEKNNSIDLCTLRPSRSL